LKNRAAAFLVAAVPFAIGLYAAFQTTFGATWSHNAALDQCTIAGPAHAQVAATDRLLWWPPLGHAHRCVYDLSKGRRVTRQVPETPK
jgi:hypothetical protein